MVGTETLMDSRHFLPPFSPLSRQQFMQKMGMRNFKVGVGWRNIEKLT
jgi:hypothetical protein